MEKLYQKIVPAVKKPISNKETLAKIISNLEAEDKNALKQEQIGFDIKVKREHELKKKTRNWVRVAHVNPYWRNFSAVTMIVTAICSSGVLLFLILANFYSLPPQIPIIYNQSIEAWSYISKDLILLIPIIHMSLIVIFLRLNMSIFKFDRRLVLTLNNSLILFNIIYLIEIFQIFTMLQVY